MRWLALLTVLACVPQSLAAEVHVAVAANFTAPAEAIAAAFEADSGHRVILSFGATGGLYAQITQAAPFEVFLSADASRPAQAIADGFGVEASSFTYAIGRLVLFSPTLALEDGAAVLRAGAFDRLAIADPATAPYGAAARDAMVALGVAEALAAKLVTGENIAQTLQFVETGNAELGFVALSQVIRRGGSQWLVPEYLHQPIRQDAVLLRTGAGNPAAAEFLAFLRSPEARRIIAAFGYALPSGP